MSNEIMDDYDAGFQAGKRFAQDNVLELMDEVIHEYRSLTKEHKMDSESGRVPKAQLNAAEFIKHWIMSGGLTDLDGNRACLPW